MLQTKTKKKKTKNSPTKAVQNATLGFGTVLTTLDLLFATFYRLVYRVG